MFSSAFAALLLLGWPAEAQTSNPFNFVSAATLFTGPSSPIINTGYGKFQGKDDHNTQTSNYLGIKFANAPRLDHSTLADQKFSGVKNVSDYGPACPQHELTSEFEPDTAGLGGLLGLIEAGVLSPALKQSEDCLLINVQRPQNIPTSQKLPVVMWIHGGGFESGASSSLISETSVVQGVVYQGANIVNRSIAMGKPIVFTSIQYRLNNFGFSASREMKNAGLLNLGFEDQRNAMRWVQKYISRFGGDPSKVTIMGESAGSWSVTGHLLANNGNNQGLFRGAVGISGGPVKVDGPERQQGTFNAWASCSGCGTATDKIACLRTANYTQLYGCTQDTNYFIGYRSLASAWTLRPDGNFFAKSPDLLAQEGKIANVPLMYGDMRDEGTLFSQLNGANTTTDAEFAAYFKTYWWPAVSSAQMAKLMTLYPENPAKGSPFGTGLLYAVPPQYKRISALTGDYSFESQRRQLLAHAPGPKWNYLTEQRVPAALIAGSPISSIPPGAPQVPIPLLGSFHASDVILNFFGTLPADISLNTYHLMGVLIAFVHDLDPNTHGMSGVPRWPNYNTRTKKTMHWKEQQVNIITDDYRVAQMDYINQIADALRI